jgi:hypothetical protein
VSTGLSEIACLVSSTVSSVSFCVTGAFLVSVRDLLVAWFFARAVHARRILNMVHCPCCYQDDPICPKGNDPSKECTGFTPSAQSCRQVDGNYSVSFRSTLPSEIRSADGVHLDHLTSYASGVGGTNVLSTEESNISNDLTTIALGNIGDVLTLAEKRPALMPQLRQGVSRLLNAGPNAAQSNIISSALTQLNSLETSGLKDIHAGSIASTTVFKVSNYPMATLLQNIVKAVEKGNDATAEVQHEMLDVATGKKVIPFEKSTKVTSDVNFMYSIHVFVTSITAIKKEAPKVYYTFSKEMKRACSVGGYLFAQQYADAILRSLDEGLFKDPVSLFLMGEHNRIYDEIWSQRSTTKSIRLNPNDSFQRIKFGPVTTPVGGKGAGVVLDPKTKQKIKCNRFHATPQQPCTAGIPKDDPRYGADMVGLCAYAH